MHDAACGAPEFQSACNIFGFGTYYSTTYNPPPYTSCSGGGSANASPGTVMDADGDGGLATNYGFYHQDWTNTKSGYTNTTASDQFLLPKGTVCGLKEALHDTTVTCMGHDANAATNPCPTGWSQKFRNDTSAPSGGRFVWCEYQDPHGLCTSGTCYYTQQPVGIVCGATDTGKVYPGNSGGGQCMGLQPTPSNCSSLGYTYFAADAGAGSGSGLGYCIKQ
jgi:hypothetical protein